MNIKRTIAGITVFCLMGTVMPNVAGIADNAVITANAEDYTEGTYQQFTYKNYGDYIEISKCDSSATEVVIPAEIYGVPVTSIGEEAFYWCMELTSVEIPDSVKNIGAEAFHTCTWLTSVTIPDSVESIGERAFYWCHRLASINVSENNRNYSSADGVLFNKDKTELIQYPGGKNETEYVIPDGVTAIGNDAFMFCEGLTSIQFPDSIAYIGNNVFTGTSWLEEKRNENPLVTVNGILVDGTACSGDVVIPDGVKSIGGYAFLACTDLTSAEIPGSVTSIGYGAFKDCSGLTSAVIHDGVTSIGEMAFAGCTGLTSAEIPDSVASIGKYAFNSCTDMTAIKIFNPECEIYDGAGVINYTAVIYGYENSTAQEYAEKYDMEFKSLGEAPVKESVLGDVNGDGKADATDASFILAEYAVLSTSGDGTFTEDMKKYADINRDGKVDSVDSSLILSYYAYTSTGGTDTIDKYLEL